MLTVSAMVLLRTHTLDTAGLLTVACEEPGLLQDFCLQRLQRIEVDRCTIGSTSFTILLDFITISGVF